ncbi:MAG: terminase [Candidatus Kapaibacterium sp.]|nr:MAG: terminase [Candidatus Kapabacteria bacterium]
MPQQKNKTRIVVPPARIAGYSPLRTAGRCRFDARRAQHAIDYFERQLTHVYGFSGPFVLEQWQREVIATITGWVRPDGTRRYREVFIAIPRKNGKTQMCAGLGLYLFDADNEPGSQVILAARTRDQATHLYSVMAGMCRQNERLDRETKILDATKRIIKLADSSWIRAIAADAGSAHGFNAHAVIIDELHAQKSRDLYDVLKTSTGSRKQPLVITMTTAGHNKQSFCYELWQYAADVRDGKVKDPYFLPVIYAADPEDDFADERTWEKANPNLNVTISRDYLREMAQRAQTTTALEFAFRRMHLNQWTDSTQGWLSDAAWMACYAHEWPELDGAVCYAGIDLGSTDDLTSMVYAFPMGEYVYVKCYAWCAEQTVRMAASAWQSLYRDFAARGYLHVTPGKSADYRAILAQLRNDIHRYRIMLVGLDIWQAAQLAEQIEKDIGIPVARIPQTCAGLTLGTRTVESLVLENRLRHDGNELLRWAVNNVEIQQDHAGNRKPDKRSRSGKIDPANAMVMAVQVAFANGMHHAIAAQDEILSGVIWL